MGNMIVGLFCIMVFCQFPYKTDMDHSLIYLVCCMLFALCENGHAFESHQDSVRELKVGDHNYCKEQCLKSKSWCHFLGGEGNHGSGLQSQAHKLWCSPYNAPTIQFLSKFKSTLIFWYPISNTIFRTGCPTIVNITMSSNRVEEAL